MKVTLDIDRLLSDGKVTQAEYDKLAALSAEGTGSLTLNILIGFGVVAVSGAALALLPSSATAIVVGCCILAAGLRLLLRGAAEWRVLANICVLVGALMTGGGTGAQFHGSIPSLLIVAAVFAAASVIARSSLLSVLAVLALSGSTGAGTDYSHATYFLIVEQPILTIAFFSVLFACLCHLARRVPAESERIVIAASRTSFVLVNFGFWVGSLWGPCDAVLELLVPRLVFSLLWGAGLVATGVWAWKRDRKWVLNTVAIFGGIHFYTQWFETLGASPGTVLMAGFCTIGVAVAIQSGRARARAMAEAEMVTDKGASAQEPGAGTR